MCGSPKGLYLFDQQKIVWKCIYSVSQASDRHQTRFFKYFLCGLPFRLSHTYTKAKGTFLQLAVAAAASMVIGHFCLS